VAIPDEVGWGYSNALTGRVQVQPLSQAHYSPNQPIESAVRFLNRCQHGTNSGQAISAARSAQEQWR
jgi:hypothetical protein